MNRVQDYMGFALWFVGLGYMALSPLTAHDNGLAAFDLIFVCDRRFFAAELICPSHGALHLSPGLHLVGLLGSAWVLAGLVLRPVRRWRRSRAAVHDRSLFGAVQLRPKRPAPPPRRYVKPRSHFGLRGVPR